MKVTVVACMALALVGCGSSDPGSEALEAQARHLEVESKLALDLDEVSGIAPQPRAAADDALTFVAIGDASRRIAVAVADDPPYQADDIYEGDNGASQWESVAVDGAGQIFVLDEGGDRIEIFDDAGERTGELALELSGDLAELWAAEPNTQGEGLVLLANSHVLVLKERAPTLIVEFGPSGETAKGYRPTLALDVDEAFAPKDLVALHHWELHESLASRAKDMSDLCVGPGGRLFALSDESRVIIQLERELSASEQKIEARQFYDLPGRIEKPEGLSFPDGGLSPVVADDNDNNQPDVFWLSPVAAP